MISPLRPLNIKSGDSASVVKDCSIWNSQFKLRLLNLTIKLENAIQQDDRGSVEYFMGLINRCKYHPNINWSTFVLIDMLLLPKTPRYLRKGYQNDRKKPQHPPGRKRRRRTLSKTVPPDPISTGRTSSTTISTTISDPTATRTKKKRKGTRSQ